MELHPLALEDVLANRGPAHSKADYYSKHLSLRIQCHTIQSEDEESLQLLTKSAFEKELTRSNSPESMTADEEKLADSTAGMTLIGSQLSLGSRRLGEGICGNVGLQNRLRMKRVLLYLHRILQSFPNYSRGLINRLASYLFRHPIFLTFSPGGARAGQLSELLNNPTVQ